MSSSRAADQPTTIVGTGRAVSLDAFATAAANLDGIDVRGLEPLTVLLIRTKNSAYRITATGERTAIVQGGAFFQEPARAEITGATLGGSFLKVGWIAVGLCLELMVNEQRIVTTRVRTISVESPARRSH